MCEDDDDDEKKEFFFIYLEMPSSNTLHFTHTNTMKEIIFYASVCEKCAKNISVTSFASPNLSETKSIPNEKIAM